MKGTRGTETSKYPEEEKERSIPGVAASEMGRAQTSVRACWGYGLHKLPERIVEWFWESQPERVRAPYTKSGPGRQDPEYHETRGTLWEVGGTTPQG